MSRALRARRRDLALWAPFSYLARRSDAIERSTRTDLESTPAVVRIARTTASTGEILVGVTLVWYAR